MRKRIRRMLIVTGAMYVLMIFVILLFAQWHSPAPEACPESASAADPTGCIELSYTSTDRVALEDITDLVAKDPGTFAFRLFCCCSVIGTLCLLMDD